MTKRYLSKLFFPVLLLCLSAFAGKRPKTPRAPSVTGVQKIFVAGNNEAASAIRKAMPGFCFSLAPKADEAGAVLEISQEQTSATQRQPLYLLGPYGQVQVPFTTVSGTLKNNQDKLLWSESDGEAGEWDSIRQQASSTGASTAALVILGRLRYAAFPNAKLKKGQIVSCQ